MMQLAGRLSDLMTQKCGAQSLFAGFSLPVEGLRRKLTTNMVRICRALPVKQGHVHTIKGVSRL